MTHTLVHDLQRGVKVTMDFDEAENQVIFKQYDDLDPMLDLNQELRGIEDQSMIGNTQRHMQHVASIPLPIYYLWKSVLGDPHLDETANKKWIARLNSSEFRKFRTGGGHL